MTVVNTRAGLFRVVAGVILGSIGLVGLSGCTANVPDENPYAEEISRAFDNAESDYVRDILSDGQITAAEVRDAQQHNVACLSEAGISAQYVDSGAGYENLQLVELRDDKLDEEYACHKKWVGEVYGIYINQITNPQKGDFDALIAACFVTKGLVPEGFTGSDFRELREPSGERVSISESGEGRTEAHEIEPIMLPGGESMDNPQAVMCLVNPSL